MYHSKIQFEFAKIHFQVLISIMQITPTSLEVIEDDSHALYCIHCLNFNQKGSCYLSPLL